MRKEIIAADQSSGREITPSVPYVYVESNFRYTQRNAPAPATSARITSAVKSALPAQRYNRWRKASNLIRQEFLCRFG